MHDTQKPARDRGPLRWLFIIGGGLMLYLLFTQILAVRQAPPVAYSELKAMLRDGKVSEVVVSPTRIIAELPDNSRVESVRIDDPTGRHPVGARVFGTHKCVIRRQ